jgi:hypothetical protein
MTAQETCRLAAELKEEFGDLVARVAERAIVSYEADGLTDRATLWRALHAIIADISAQRLDPYAKIAIH